MILQIHNKKPTTNLNCIAIATLRKFCVPNANPIRLDKQPLMMYFLNPNAAQIATAKGADSWNSMPGTRLGILIAPKIVIIAVRIPISVI